jgi:hypothetical protein
MNKDNELSNGLCFSPRREFEGKVAFAVGTGRCGTKFIYEVFKRNKDVLSWHERHPLNDAFHKYCKWYGLPIDNSGFLMVKENSIRKDLENHEFSFEASAHLSLSIKELNDHFGGKIIYLIRNPADMINSYLKKGWYCDDIFRKDIKRAPSINKANPMPSELWHFWGRILPTDENAAEWNKLSRIGKLAWFWTSLNKRILDELKEMPDDQYTIVKLEELGYDRYLKITEFLKIVPHLAKDAYEAIALERPNKLDGVSTIKQWNHKEKKEYLSYVKNLSEVFGYNIETKTSYYQFGDAKSEKIRSFISVCKKPIISKYKKFILSQFRKFFYAKE